MDFAKVFLDNCTRVINQIDSNSIERAAQILAEVRAGGGRLFIIGSGGGAGHASHATCDFRKLCNIEAYAPYDNVSELTARVNDEGWETTLAAWLEVSRLQEKDSILIFSVGGGSQEKKVSMNIVNAIKLAQNRKAKIVAVVGRDGGFSAQAADAAIIIPPIAPELITPLTEGFQALIWHLLVSHPLLQVNTAKWELISSSSSDTKSALS